MQTAPTIPAKLQFASNKKIDKQMRFHSVKKRRSKNRIRYAKPTREDHNNFFEELGIIILIILFTNNNAVFYFYHSYHIWSSFANQRDLTGSTSFG